MPTPPGNFGTYLTLLGVALMFLGVAMLVGVLLRRIRSKRVAAEEVRFATTTRTIMAALAPGISSAIHLARTTALHEAADIIHARIRDREQPLTIQTQDGPVASGEGPSWAISDLQLVEQLIRQRADPAQQAADLEGKP